MREQCDAEQTVLKYADLVKRICVLHLKNPHDTEDVFQNVFMKYILYSGTFENAEHEKAWFIRVTLNACKDWIKSLMRHPAVSLDLISEEASASVPEENKELLSAVLSLPVKYKEVIYLFYYEGYSAIEIAKLLGKNEGTVYSLLSRARKLLKERLGGEEFE